MAIKYNCTKCGALVGDPFGQQVAGMVCPECVRQKKTLAAMKKMSRGSSGGGSGGGSCFIKLLLLAILCIVALFSLAYYQLIVLLIVLILLLYIIIKASTPWKICAVLILVAFWGYLNSKEADLPISIHRFNNLLFKK